MSDFFSSASCLWDSFILWCVSVVHLLLLLRGVPLYGYITIYLCLLLLRDVWVVSHLARLWAKSLCGYPLSLRDLSFAKGMWPDALSQDCSSGGQTSVRIASFSVFTTKIDQTPALPLTRCINLRKFLNFWACFCISKMVLILPTFQCPKLETICNFMAYSKCSIHGSYSMMTSTIIAYRGETWKTPKEHWISLFISFSKQEWGGFFG